MNVQQLDSSVPVALISSLHRHRTLIWSLIRREVLGRYRGSMMGLMWSFFNPVLMLAVYTFVFSMIFKSRWPGGSGSKTEFAMVLFAGLMFFNLFSECVSRAPGLILGNVNYVKKVVFPLELLPVVVFGSAAFHFLISLLVWLIFYGIFFGVPPLTIFWLPLVVVPLSFFTLGVSWLLASLGVYVRDVSQMVGVFITVLMFLTPIFYPESYLPEKYHFLMNINPLTFVVVQAREVMIFGHSLNFKLWFLQFAVSIFVAWFGFFSFQKLRNGFADVL